MTYDQWKTTDPREYEQTEEDQPTELDAAYDRVRQLQDDAKHVARVSAKRIAELETALCECLEYFKDRYDVKDGDYDEQLPNEEMQLGTMVEAALYGNRF